MKRRNLIPISLLVWGLLALFLVATSSDNIVPRKITAITIPGNLPITTPCGPAGWPCCPGSV